MSSRSTPMQGRARARVQKLPCNGHRCFRVGRQSNLAYGEAWDAIFKEENCRDDPGTGRQTFTHKAVRRLTKFNEIYAAMAREFLLVEIPRRRKIAEEMGEKLKVEFAEFKQFQDHETELANLRALVTQGQTVTPELIAQLEETIANSVWQRTGESDAKGQLKYRRKRAPEPEAVSS